jgi:hypothetical protein
MRLVATLTSVPGREDILIEACRSIANQTVKPDAIYLTIPKFYSRLGKTYEKIPEEIKTLCTIVNIDEDFGPISKIYGGISQETDPETIIISCDDDIKYPPTTFAELLEKSREYPDASICGSGMLVKKGLTMCSMYTNMSWYKPYNGIFGFIPPKNGRKVDLIFGSSGVLYKRKFFGSFAEAVEKMFKIAFVDHSIFCNDDVLISAYLQKRNIDRITFPNLTTVDIIKGQHHEVALSFDPIKTAKRMEKSIKFLHNMGYLLNYEPMAIDETMASSLGIAIILGIVIAILAVIMWFTLFNPVDPDTVNKIIFI